MKLTMMIVLALLAGAASAKDTALLIGNERYRSLDEVSGGGAIFDAAPALERAGFDVLTGRNASTIGMVELLRRLARVADGSGRIVIAVSGHVVRSVDESWILGSEAHSRDRVNVGLGGIRVALLQEIAARAPGAAVVLLGLGPRELQLGEGLEAGIRLADIPQGVTVVYGPPRDIAEFARIELAAGDRSLADAMADWPKLRARGFLAPLVPFRGGPAASSIGDGLVSVDRNADQRAFWQATQGIATVDAYQSYLNRYPNGLFVNEARGAIAEINARPQLRAESDEQALRLSRDDRRAIQRRLTLLGYNTRGIDGVFGRGSRGAITNWQRDNSADQTGYVTRAMIERLAAQADLRQAELEREAQAREEEQRRRDRGYWLATGAAGDEAGLRAYLERFPDGVFAEVALARLEPYEAARRQAAAGQDRADWDAAQARDDLRAYRRYLQANPQGAFEQQARVRIGELEFQERNASALQAAQRNEQRLGLNDGTRRLVENQLNKLGLKPGQVDGTFDKATRRAIRRYQDARKMQVTGFLNQATMVRLLTDSVLR